MSAADFANVRRYRFRADDPQIDIEVPIGNRSARPVGGLGGWQEAERQDDVSASVWEGQESLKQDITLLLDGYDEDESVEREMATIFKLGRDPNGERVPPVFRVWGPMYFGQGKAWVLPPNGIDLDSGEIETIRRKGDNELLRQEVTLHLVEFNPFEEVKIRHLERPKMGLSGNVAVGGTYTTKHGDTLHKIAAKLFRDTKDWKQLGEANGISDPMRKLPAGLVLKIP